MTIRQFSGLFSEIEDVINLEKGKNPDEKTFLDGKSAALYFDKLAQKNMARKK